MGQGVFARISFYANDEAKIHYPTIAFYHKIKKVALKTVEKFTASQWGNSNPSVSTDHNDLIRSRRFCRDPDRSVGIATLIKKIRKHLMVFIDTILLNHKYNISSITKSTRRKQSRPLLTTYKFPAVLCNNLLPFALRLIFMSRKLKISHHII